MKGIVRGKLSLVSAVTAGTTKHKLFTFLLSRIVYIRLYQAHCLPCNLCLYLSLPGTLSPMSPVFISVFTRHTVSHVTCVYIRLYQAHCLPRNLCLYPSLPGTLSPMSPVFISVFTRHTVSHVTCVYICLYQAHCLPCNLCLYLSLPGTLSPM